jgi:hypothetical protein
MWEMNRGLLFQAAIAVSKARAQMEIIHKLCLRCGAARAAWESVCVHVK